MAAETATVLRVLVELLRDEDVQHVIDRMIVRRIAEPQWGPPVGRVLASLLAENRQEALIQLLADRAFQWSLNAGRSSSESWSAIRPAGRPASSTTSSATGSTAN